MPVTAVVAALLTLLFLALSVRVIRVRRAAKTAIGDGGSAGLLRATRVHGNFAEYAPLALILLGLSESLHAPRWLVAVLGVALLTGRLVHAIGVSQRNENLAFRTAGMMLTFGVLICAATTCLIAGLGNF